MPIHIKMGVVQKINFFHNFYFHDWKWGQYELIPPDCCLGLITRKWDLGISRELSPKSTSKAKNSCRNSGFWSLVCLCVCVHVCVRVPIVWTEAKTTPRNYHSWMLKSNPVTCHCYGGVTEWKIGKRMCWKQIQTILNGWHCSFFNYICNWNCLLMFSQKRVICSREVLTF